MATVVEMTDNERAVYSSLYENDLFVEQICEEFKCCICLCVLRDPQQLACGHLYCKMCITTLFQTNSGPNTCPIDRRPSSLADVRPAPKAICNLIEQFEVKCRNHEDGCTVFMPLSQLDRHEVICRFSPCNGLTAPTTSSDIVSVEVSSLPMTIQVRLVDIGKTAFINISLTDNVLTLKRRIHEKEGLDVESMILTNGTTPLADNRRLLVEYNVKNGSVIFSTRRCNGGQQSAEDSYNVEILMTVARIKLTILATQLSLSEKRGTTHAFQKRLLYGGVNVEMYAQKVLSRVLNTMSQNQSLQY